MTLMAAPQLARTMEGHSSYVEAVAVSPDGCFIYSGSDKTVRQWEASSGAVRAVMWRCGGVCDVVVALQLVRTLEGHSAMIRAIAVSPDGLFVYSGGDDATVKQWNASLGAVRDAACGCGGVCDATAAGADAGRSLGQHHVLDRVARRSICLFRQQRKDRGAMGCVQRGGACCCIVLRRCVCV